MNFRLKEIVLSIASGITINHSSKGTYPVYGSTGIIGYTNSNDYSGERILIARVGANAGATNIVCGEYGVSDNTLVITVDSEYETKYIYYFLKHKKLNQFVFGSGQPLITGSLLKNISLYIPDRISQQHIAEALSDVDGMISSLEKLIAKYKSIKTACLQQMFPQNGETVPRMRLPGFTGAWEQRKLGEVSESYSGGTPSVGVKEYYGGQIPFIRSAEINSEITELFLTEEGLKNSSARLVAVGDILYALYGATSGEVGRARLKGAINQAILAIKPHTDYDSEYLAQWLRKSKHSIIETYLQGGQGNLSGTIVKELSVDFPSLKEQKAIGDFFRQLDNLITLHQRKLEKIQKIKQGMMQQLLTGKIRLV